MIKNIGIELVERNLKFKRKVMQELESIEIGEIVPKFPILFLTCMDPRIDINKIFQFNSGDVFVLRNAGNLYTLDVLRSILLAIVKFNIKYIIVLGHLDCGMAKINLKELREKLPLQFLSSLSKNYYEHIPKLKVFFKPILDEIQNIKEQIKKLELIQDFYPETEIIGMLYDVKTGLVFEYETFKEYENIESFKKNYKELLINKKNQFTDFLEEIETENITIDDSNDLSQDKVLIEGEDSSISKNNDEIKGISISEHDELKEKLKTYSSTIIPKITIPKIQFQGVKIYLPKISKEKRKISIKLENK